MTNWHFRKIARGEPIKEPTQGQFFNWDSIAGTPGKAVVREGIQNALDARQIKNNVKDKAKVRIEVIRREEIGKEKDLFFSGNWYEHIYAEKNGLVPEQIPQNNEAKAYKFLVFEDFNTTGLTGDEKHHVSKTDKGNNFFNFFRAVGSTDKEGAALGKWGVGKHTFWSASQVNTVFGFTVKEGEVEMLCLGKTILKSHAIGGSNDKDYQDGYYGIMDDGLVLPIRGDDALKLAEMFGLKRTTEPGLSLIVPWMDNEIKPEDIQKSVVEDYFYPILAGRLEVSLMSGIVNASNIESYAENSETKNLISLARDFMGHGNDKMVEIEPTDRKKPNWNEVIFNEEYFNVLRKEYLARNTIFVRVNVDIVKHGCAACPSYFDIAMKRIEGSKKRPLFIREDIIISEANGRQTPNTLALVVAEDSDITAFLNKSENPSHTMWQADLSKNDYQNAPTVIRFIRNSAAAIIEILAAGDREKDKTLLKDIFPRIQRQQHDGHKKHTSEPVTPLISKPQKCRIHPTKQGFGVSKGDADVPLQSMLEVSVAYKVHRGSAKYNKLDFNLGDSATFVVEHQGLDIVNQEGNVIRARITNPDFKLSVNGFDENRDLRIRAEVTISA